MSFGTQKIIIGGLMALTITFIFGLALYIIKG